LSNIALDLIGQARYLYQYAAKLIHESEGIQTTEDQLAYLRDGRAFRNFLLVELPNGDWGHTVLRQCFFSVYQHCLYNRLVKSADKELSAIASKAVKEVAYHVKWSAEWVIRLGDGTGESHRRMQMALEQLWPYTGELYNAASFEMALSAEGIAIDPREMKEEGTKKMTAILQQATLKSENKQVPAYTGGKEGLHTEHLGFLLAEMQFLQRAYPGNEW
jgi:ring-1,2-phenylacetyl-CoA epoxidase subunit PaaC